MVTRAQVTKLAARIDAIAEVQNPPARLVVFWGETPEQAKHRHLELRPEDRGKRMKLEWRTTPRDDVNEIFATCTLQEIRAAADSIDRANKAEQGA